MKWKIFLILIVFLGACTTYENPSSIEREGNAANSEQDNGVSIIDIIVASTAVGSLVLSIFNFLSFKKDKKLSLKVKITNGAIGLPNGELSELMLFPSAANPTERTIKVVNFAFLLPNKSTLIIPRLQGMRELPLLLEPLDSSEFYVPKKDVQNALIRAGYSKNTKIRARFTDALGNGF